MARQHELIINRILANILKEELDQERLEYGESRLNPIFGVLGLCQSDVDAIIKAGHKRLKQLERISQPLGPKISLWIDDLGGEG